MRVMIIAGSVRPGRIGLPIARWVESIARERPGMEIDFVDLVELGLPFMDEPHHPRLQQYTQPHTRAWSERVQAADAVILVTPEYNHSYSPALKNALDYLHREWWRKPVGFVSYGGVSGGMRSVQTGKLMVTGFKMMPMVEAVNIPFFSQLMENGVFKSNELHDKAVPVMLDELLRWSGALKTLRGH